MGVFIAVGVILALIFWYYIKQDIDIGRMEANGTAGRDGATIRTKSCGILETALLRRKIRES